MCNKRDQLPGYITHYHPLGVPPFDAYRVSFWDKSNQPLSISECDAPLTVRGPTLRRRLPPASAECRRQPRTHLRRLQNRPRGSKPRRRPVFSSFRIACALRGNPRTEVTTYAPREAALGDNWMSGNLRTGGLPNCPWIKEVWLSTKESTEP
jgi:hypothetical protein